MAKRKSVPAYQLHRASGQARVKIDGRDVYLGEHGSPESRAAYALQIANHAAGEGRPVPRIPTPQSTITVGECVLRFLVHAKTLWPQPESGKRNAEYLQYDNLLRRLLNDKFGNLPADLLTGPRVKELQTAMVEKRRWARKHCNAMLRRLKRFARWCLTEDLISAETVAKICAVEPLRAGRTTAPERPRILPIDESTFQRTLPHLPEVVADMLRLMRYCGARPSEIRRLKIGDIDASGDVWEATLQLHKTLHRGKERKLFFGPKSQAILQKYLSDRRPDEHVFSPRDSERRRELARRAARKTKMTPSQRQRRKKQRKNLLGFYKRAQLRRAVMRGCEKAFEMPDRLRYLRLELTDAMRAEIDALPKKGRIRQRRAKQLRTPTPDQRAQLVIEQKAWRKQFVWTPNRLRHLRATEIRKMFGIEDASVTLGHSGVPVTELYAERDFDRVRQIMRAVG
jgi:integrase